MKRFRSRVAALLDLRRRREEELLRAHARALHARQAALDHLDSVSAALGSIREDIRAALGAGCSSAVLSRFRGYGARLDDDRARAAEALVRAEAEAARSLREVTAARRERESVEKYRERERLAHEQELLREEQKVLDEIALRPVPRALADPIAS